jgi:Phage P22-like portal protein
MEQNDDLQIGEAEVWDESQISEHLGTMRDRYQRGAAANEENRRLHTEDLCFAFDAEQFGQWDPMVISQRQGRPSYTFNRVLSAINMVLGDQRQTRPAIKVRPSSENASQATAEKIGGLWRSIEQDSRAEAIYDECYKHSVAGGFGELRILPEWKSPESFDQCLRIKNIPNPLTVIRDPESTDPCGADAKWAMVGDKISNEAYDAEFPEFAGKRSTFMMSRDSLGWYNVDQTRVVEYFERVPFDKEIALLSDGRVVDWTDKEKAVEKHLSKTGRDGSYAKVVRTRKVRTHKIRYTKCDGANILEGPTLYDWKRIPVVRMPGRYINIEGKMKLQSLIRHSKDSQRAYNFQSSDAIERSALVPKARYFVTPKMILGFEDLWNSSNTSPRIYMPFNVDKDAPNNGAPFREQPIDVPAGAIAMAQKAAQDIQATTGFFDPALGNADDMNRVSGKALVTHTRRSDLGSHEFIDNYGKALQLLAEIGIDMMRSVYDTERTERVLHADGTDEQVTFNGEDGEHDLTSGSYGCTVTIGPAYQTERQETLATLIDAAQTIPAIAQVAPDLIAKAIDSPDSEELNKRLRMALIRQGVIQPTDKEKEEMGPPPQPNPVQQAEAMRSVALAHKDAADAFIAQNKAAGADVAHRRLIAETVREELNNILKAQQIGAQHPETFAAHLQTELLKNGGNTGGAPPAAQAA